MTPFEEVMEVIKQVGMLIERAVHNWNYDVFHDNKNYLYSARYTAVTLESALLIHELLHGKKNITCLITNKMLYVECPISPEEREQVRKMEDY